MTDNRTTELLRKLLDERGVEHEDYAYVIQDTQERCEITRVRDYAGRVKARFMSCNEPGKVDVAVKLTPEQAIAATLWSEREIELGDALNEVAEKWAIAQVEAEDYAKRCMLLEELVRDAYWLIARAVCTHVSQDKFAADWTERVSVLGIEVD